MNFRLSIFLLLFSIALSISCEADIDMDNVSDEIVDKGTLVLPIGSVNVFLGQGIKTYYEDGNIDTNNPNEIVYHIDDSMEVAYRPLQLIKNNNLTNKILYFPNSPLNVRPNSHLPQINDRINIQLDINQNVNDDRIDSIHIKHAIFSVSLYTQNIRTNDLNTTLKIKFLAPNVKMLNGNSNEITIDRTALNTPFTIDLYDFMLYDLDPRHFLPIEVSISMKNGDNEIILNNNSAINFAMSLDRLQYNTAWGFFSSSLFEERNDTIDFKTRYFLPKGLFKLSNPKIDITLQTNIGTYFDYKMKYFKAISTIEPVNYTPIYLWFNNRTTNAYQISIDKKPTKPGEIAEKKFETFDKDNGETHQLFEQSIQPDKIVFDYKLNINTNLIGNENSANFITSSPMLKYKYRITVPFSLNSGSYYLLEDSVDNPFKALKNINNFDVLQIDSLNLLLVIKNGLPIKSSFNLEFTDSIGNKLLPDFEKNYIINAGKVDVNGIVKAGQETVETIQIKFSANQFYDLIKVKRLYYKIKLEAKDLNSKIHFTPNDHIQINPAIYLKYKIDTTKK